MALRTPCDSSSFHETLRLQGLRFMGWGLSCFGFFDHDHDHDHERSRLDRSPSSSSAASESSNGKFCAAAMPISDDSESSSSLFGADSAGSVCDVNGFSVPSFASRRIPVKETHCIIRSEDAYGHKTINEYVREKKIGAGSYGKVVLHRNTTDGKLYALKIFHKKRLSKVHVSPAETALTDVLREVAIMKRLDHPNIVSLIEVIDDPDSDVFYMVLEYVEGSGIFQGCGPIERIREETARKYFKDIVTGLKYLHSCNIVHGDIKPENLLVSSNGVIKICDFSSSKVFEGSNDELRRSPGTPVFTAPECCLGLTYHGKIADVWALGVTIYCMVLGCYPFVGESLQETYDKIVHDPLFLPETMDSDLVDLFQQLLCKDPKKRITLHNAEMHPWVLKGSLTPISNSEDHEHVYSLYSSTII